MVTAKVNLSVSGENNEKYAVRTQVNRRFWDEAEVYVTGGEAGVGCDKSC